MDREEDESLDSSSGITDNSSNSNSDSRNSNNSSNSSNSRSSSSSSRNHNVPKHTSSTVKLEIETDSFTESEGSQNGLMKRISNSKDERKLMKKAKRGQAVEYKLAQIGPKATNRFKKVIIQ